MKKMLIAVLAAALLAACCTTGKGICPMKKTDIVRHVVLFAYKAGTTPDQARDIEKRFLDLKNKIDGVLDLEGGADISAEKMQQGFTHCFVVSFVNTAARDAYLPHPAHQEFVKFLGPYIEKALVIDFQPAK